MNLVHAPNRQTPVLVLADVQRPWEGQDQTRDPDFIAAANRCHEALLAARGIDLPVAFVRRVRPWLLAASPWLSGFSPATSDMIFERTHHSCYASHAFAQMAEAAGSLALAGFFSESTIVATAIDALEHGNEITFLADASWSSSSNERCAADVHHAATVVITRHASVCTTETWISAMALERK